MCECGGGGLLIIVYINSDAHSLLLQHFTKLDHSRRGPWPVRRSVHAACCINYGEEHSQLLVSGGRDNDNNTLSDMWLLDVNSRTWKEVRHILPNEESPYHGDANQYSHT